MVVIKIWFKMAVLNLVSSVDVTLTFNSKISISYPINKVSRGIYRNLSMFVEIEIIRRSARRNGRKALP